MTKKTLTIFACTTILLGSAAVAWGIGSWGTAAKPAQTTSFTPPEQQFNVKVRSLPHHHQTGDLSFVFTD